MVAHEHASVRGGADILALAFGTTVAMWFAGYLARLPLVAAPGWLLGIVMLSAFVGGGVLAGRSTVRGVWGGVWVGLVAAVLDLMILGSVLADAPRGLGLLWLPAFLALGAVLGGIGAAVGAAVRRPAEVRWSGVFAAVAAAATFLLLIAGGMVTSAQAGLAVTDWPNSFGTTMFLYPLSRMTGGIYYEHAHRLFGSLVGLTTVVLAIHLARTESRRWVRRLGGVAVAMVIVQGILGGLRVTGHFTLSTSAADMRPSIILAVVHGVFGQLFFALMVGLAAFTSRTWTSDRSRAPLAAAGVDRVLTALLPGLLLVQLVLGAVQRHLARGLMIHITLAVIVVAVGVTAGVRAWALADTVPLVARLGEALLGMLVLQVTLGFGALLAVVDGGTGSWQITVATAHQASGALLLATAVLLALWQRRLVARPH